MRDWIEWSSHAIQALAVVIILVSIVFGTVRCLRQLFSRVTDSYRAYKQLLGRSLLLALELLVAADVIRTVLLDLTAKGMEILGALVLIRTFLSWSLVVELEGHWPWCSSALDAQSQRGRESGVPDRAYGSLERLDKRIPTGIESPASLVACDGESSSFKEKLSVL